VIGKENKMLYIVMSFVGDYPVNDQPLWDKTFDELTNAIASAELQQGDMLYKWPGLYTMVLDHENAEQVFYLIYNGNKYINDAAQEMADKLVEHSWPPGVLPKDKP
jgi:hypothetical protein